MNKRIVGILLAVLAGAILLVLVGGAAYKFGTSQGEPGGRVFGPFGGHAMYMGTGGYWLFGLLAMILVGLVVVWLIATIVGWGRESSQRPVAPPPPGAPFGLPPQDPDGLARLKELSDLHDRGALTDEEFTAAKRRLLGL